MAEELRRAAQYRERAAELRAVAEWMKDPHALTQILATAIEYDRMAETVEKISRGHSAEHKGPSDDADDAIAPSLPDEAPASGDPRCH